MIFYGTIKDTKYRIEVSRLRQQPITLSVKEFGMPLQLLPVEEQFKLGEFIGEFTAEFIDFFDEKINKKLLEKKTTIKLFKARYAPEKSIKYKEKDIKAFMKRNALKKVREDQLKFLKNGLLVASSRGTMSFSKSYYKHPLVWYHPRFGLYLHNDNRIISIVEFYKYFSGDSDCHCYIDNYDKCIAEETKLITYSKLLALYNR